VISIARADLAAVTASAVLRPVSAEWEAVTAAGRRLELAAGSDVEAQCRRMGELPVGSAVITGAGALPAEFLIHASVRSVDEPVSGAVVRRALQNGLRRGAEWAIDSLALGPLGTGAGNLEVEEAARIMIPVLLEHMAGSPHPARVQVVVESEYEREVFERELRSRLPPADTGYETRTPDP
jgi:O-acetyl-ADP-ribose deacetylase (regulator of RNase III)